MKQYTKEMFEVRGPLLTNEVYGRELSLRDILIRHYSEHCELGVAVELADEYIEGWLKERNGK